MKTTKQKGYESPKAEVIKIEFQGVLCASSGAAAATGGGTQGMNMTNINWP